MTITLNDEYHQRYIRAARKYDEKILGKTIFLTGLTGLFGKPLIEILVNRKVERKDDTPVYCLTRNIKCLYHKYPFLENQKFFVPVRVTYEISHMTAGKYFDSWGIC